MSNERIPLLSRGAMPWQRLLAVGAAFICICLLWGLLSPHRVVGSVPGGARRRGSFPPSAGAEGGTGARRAGCCRFRFQVPWLPASRCRALLALRGGPKQPSRGWRGASPPATLGASVPAVGTAGHRGSDSGRRGSAAAEPGPAEPSRAEAAPPGQGR